MSDPTSRPLPGGFLGGGAPCWAALGPAFGTHCAPALPHSYYKGIRQMVQVSDQDMNTHLAEISRVRGVGEVCRALGKAAEGEPGGLAPLCDGPGVCVRWGWCQL